jgi:hypothetical protein
MGDIEWLAFIFILGILLFPLGRRWYRRRSIAKSADKLLADVVKGKDAFRR